VAGWAAGAAVRSARALPRDPGSQNRHLRATTATGETWFVKVYAEPAMANVERAALTLLDGPESAPLAWGVHDGRAWLALPWLECSPASADGGYPAALGRALARVHAITPDPAGGEAASLPVVSSLTALVAVRQTAVERWSPEVASTARRLMHELRSGLRLDLEGRGRGSPSLLHGDATARNLVVVADGRTLLVDFERACIGPPELDLGQSWYAELTAARRRELRDAYRAARAARLAEPADPVSLWLAGLCHALGLIAYGERRHEATVAAAGQDMLRRLASEVHAGHPGRIPD
jgi:fructosamine-3-kinase